jgi:hypothetical protein
LQNWPSGAQSFTQVLPLQKPSQQIVSKPQGAPIGSHPPPPQTPPKQLKPQHSSLKEQPKPSGAHSMKLHTSPLTQTLPGQHGRLSKHWAPDGTHAPPPHRPSVQL